MGVSVLMMSVTPKLQQMANEEGQAESGDQKMSEQELEEIRKSQEAVKNLLGGGGGGEVMDNLVSWLSGTSTSQQSPAQSNSGKDKKK